MVALKRTLGLWDVFCLGAGVMISSGLFVLPGIAYGYAGPAVVFSYALAGLMAIPAMLSQAELASAMPKAGGTYFFVERSLGTLPGLLAGLANWLGIALKSTFALVGIGAFAILLWPELGETAVRMIAIGLCLAFCALNALSVHGAKRFQAISVTVVVVLLVGFVILGFPGAAQNRAHFASFTPHGWWAVLSTAGLVFVAYGGLTKVASVAEEVHNPSRNIPLGMFLAVVIVSLLYVGVVFVTVGVLEDHVLYDPSPGADGPNLTPLSFAAEKFAGWGGLVALSVGAVVALFTAANGGVLAASRNPMAMSRDGLLPESLQHVSKRFGTPTRSIGLTCIFMLVVLAVLDIQSLAKSASLMMLILFAMVNTAVLVMRASGVHNYRPEFRAPLYPWVQIAGVLCYVLVIVLLCADMVRRSVTAPLIVTGAFTVTGVVWYLIYIRGRVQRESAFVYMVKSIMANDLHHGGLDKELKQIALERDNVVHDHFDDLIHDCPVLDLSDATMRDNMFHQAASLLAPRVGTEEQRLYDQLMAREAESSTVIHPGLAIPHCVVEGQGIFEILLVRCKGGILFPAHDTPVKSAFVLVASTDRRNEHLRALMAIAHIVQEPDFARRWQQAPGGEHLRDILLLSGRRRHKPGKP